MAELNKATWKLVRFGEVVKLNKESSKNPMAEGLVRYVGLEHIEPGDLRIRDWGSTADGTTFTNRFRPGQVLFGKRRAYQRKVSVADFNGVCSRDIYVLETKDPDLLLPELLPYICQTDSFFDHAVGTSAGSLSPRTNWKSLQCYEFSIPSKREQQQIVRLLSKVVDSAVCNRQLLEKQSQLMKSVLESHMQIELHSSPEKESSWRLVSAEELTEEIVTKGTTPRGKLQDENTGIPFIKVYNLTFTGELDFTYRPTFVSSTGHAANSRSIVRPGDVLMNIVGPPLGKVALVPEDFPESNINQAIVRYRCKTPDLAKWLLLYLQSETAQRWLMCRSKKTSGQRNLTLALCRDLPVPLPPQGEMRHILKNMEALVQAKRGIASRLNEVQALQRSILSSLLQKTQYME